MISLLLFPIYLLAPDLQINWITEDRQVLELRLEGQDPELANCINNGLELRYRFEARLCSKSGTWSKKCSSELVQTHFLTYDPLSQNYTMVLDRHRDGKDPKSFIYDSQEKAIAAAFQVRDVDINSFGEVGPKAYLSARAFSECRGAYNNTVEELSYYLSLGLIRLSGFNTGWRSYVIK